MRNHLQVEKNNIYVKFEFIHKFTDTTCIIQEGEKEAEFCEAYEMNAKNRRTVCKMRLFIIQNGDSSKRAKKKKDMK